MKAPDAHQNPATYFGLAVGIVAAAVVLFKLNLTSDQQGIMVTALAGVLAVAIPLADAFIRRGRAQVAVAAHYEAAAQINAIAAAPEGDDSTVIAIPPSPTPPPPTA